MNIHNEKKQMIKHRFLFFEQILSELYVVFYLYIFICQQKKKTNYFQQVISDPAPIIQLIPQ